MNDLDPRIKNQKLSGSPGEILKAYTELIVAGLRQVSEEALQEVIQTLEQCANEGGVAYVVGNGGSSAIGEHLCCDWTKGTHCEGTATIKTMSLTSNVALLTALSNDFGYEVGLSKQIEYFITKRDVLLAISSSGNSENIINAVVAAKERGARVIGFTGFSGGRLKELADYSLHVPIQHYGAVEDAHQMLMHSIAQSVFEKRKSRA